MHVGGVLPLSSRFNFITIREVMGLYRTLRSSVVRVVRFDTAYLVQYLYEYGRNMSTGTTTPFVVSTNRVVRTQFSHREFHSRFTISVKGMAGQSRTGVQTKSRRRVIVGESHQADS